MPTSYAQALEIVLGHVPLLDVEQIELSVALGRVMAEDVLADMDMPPFDKSAVDGFACRMTDIVNPLNVKEIISAGQDPMFIIGPGECAKIMTGAKVPAGADCVIMVENTQTLSENQIRFLGEKTAGNICYAGEDVKKGEIVLETGLLIQPQHVAVLAAFGCVQPWVYRKARVAVLSTGDELVEPYQTPSPTQIRNSNAWQLLAQLAKLPVISSYLGIVSDQEDATYQAICNAMSTNDLVIITGGISMGDFDLVPDSLQRAGFEFQFRSIAVQPGRPTIFATNPQQKICFALPGNPVSSFNQFELLVKPALYKMMGSNHRPIEFFVPLASEYKRNKSERLSMIPVRINRLGEAEIIEYHGSAHINALTHANALMFVQQGVTKISKGEKVRVRQI